MSQNTEQNTLTFEDPGEDQENKVITEKVSVTPFDKFRLAKWILIFSAGLYVLSAVAHILMPETTQEVWNHAKVLLNSIVTLVIGFYFGSRENNH